MSLFFINNINIIPLAACSRSWCSPNCTPTRSWSCPSSFVSSPSCRSSSRSACMARWGRCSCSWQRRRWWNTTHNSSTKCWLGELVCTDIDRLPSDSYMYINSNQNCRWEKIRTKRKPKKKTWKKNRTLQ